MSSKTSYTKALFLPLIFLTIMAARMVINDGNFQFKLVVAVDTLIYYFWFLAFIQGTVLAITIAFLFSKKHFISSLPSFIQKNLANKTSITIISNLGVLFVVTLITLSTSRTLVQEHYSPTTTLGVVEFTIIGLATSFMLFTMMKTLLVEYINNKGKI